MITETNTKESCFAGLALALNWRDSGGLAGVDKGRGMYEEKHTRTWETLTAPDGKGWIIPIFLGK